ncbi:hypothetical protein BJ170DRAFT_623845 [Xylariales sp. AK1849]|nr:hypothetical protein BJ170DRAFT_623845 [Xylariales sp. AK1849]
MNVSTTEKVKRKPLPSKKRPSPSIDVSDILDDYFNDQDEEDNLVRKAKELSLETRPPMPPRPNTIPLLPTSEPSITHTARATTIPDVPNASKSFWKNAVDETIHFAGGLVSHPCEATTHFSILRHSSGLIYYKGSSTSVTITIFADAPLPLDRSFWLQRKGFSGNMGMNASALLGTSSNWVDVTPASGVLSSDMPDSDERAWQRDMGKFLKKASKDRHLFKHVARETCIIRIPAVASDGYLRIVMCTGEGRKKVLCPSPIFRIASTSSDVSSFRGASLSTMPLEAGLKVASIIATTAVNRYIGPAKVLVDNRVQTYINKYKPNFITGPGEQIAHVKSGLQSKYQTLEQNYDGTRDVLYNPLHLPDVFDSPPEVVGSDSGPEPPFPIRFNGSVARGTGQSQAQFGFPTANLSGVACDLLIRLNGIYIGWACVQPRKGLENVSSDWHEAMITIGPSPYTSPRIVTKNTAFVHIIHDFCDATFFNMKLNVIIMAYLRPMQKLEGSRPHAIVPAEVTEGADIALASLSRENWGPHLAIQKMETEANSRTVSERYVEARLQIQRCVDGIPMHLAGVRTAGAEITDRVHGRGGLYIRR